MHAPLNFGPSEQTREQRQEIARLALVGRTTDAKQTPAALLALYERYVQGNVDLYAIRLYEQAQP